MCAHLLKLLSTHDGEKFVTTGEHSTVTPCTLPEWLPANIIKAMVVEFGSRLRKELVELHQRTDILRSRTCSTDTQRMSLDSMRAPEEVSLDPKAVLEGLSYDLEEVERNIKEKEQLLLAQGRGNEADSKEQRMALEREHDSEEDA